MMKKLNYIFYPVFVLLTVFLLWLSPYSKTEIPSHLSFHTLIELISVGISFMICMVFWGVKEKRSSLHGLILSLTFLLAGCFDFLHMLSYKGMPDFISVNSVEKAIYFWIFARIFHMFGFILILKSKDCEVDKKFQKWILAFSLIIISIVSEVVIFHNNLLPTMFVEGVGLTILKVTTEYVFIFINCFIGFQFLEKFKSNPNQTQFKLLAISSFLMGLTSLAFTLYAKPNDLMNFYGHIIKSFSSAYIYLGLVKSQLLDPYFRLERTELELQNRILNMKQLEDELIRARKNSSLGSQVRGVAHDLNNVLMIISNSANSILKVEDNNRESVEKKVSQIKQAVKRSQDFLKSLINFSKNVTSEKENINFNKFYNELEVLIRPIIPKNLNLNFISKDEIELFVAKSDLEQLMFNLILNARDALEMKDGEIRVTAQKIHLDYEIKSNHYQIPKGEYLSIEVSDNGSGIKKENIENIFEPFFTTKIEGKGTGIGLATVISIMHKYHGHVTVDSTENVGTTFKLLFLPISISKEI